MKYDLVRNIIVIFFFDVSTIHYIKDYIKKPKSKEEYFKRLYQYSFKKKWNKSIEISVEVLEKFVFSIEEEIEIYLVIANNYYEMKRYSAAIDYYSRAFALAFDNESYNNKPYNNLKPH